MPLSLAATHGIYSISFPLATEMFHFARFTSRLREIIWSSHIGFPHSAISGSKPARRLPEAYRRHATTFIVFNVPRHPPYALNLMSNVHAISYLFTNDYFYNFYPLFYKLLEKFIECIPIRNRGCLRQPISNGISMRFLQSKSFFQAPYINCQ